MAVVVVMHNFVFGSDFDCSMGRIDIAELDSQMVVLVLDNL